MTATVYILKYEKVLLIYHKRLKKWLPPGGHLEAGELPHIGALREAREETGLEVELISQENIWIKERSNGGSIPRPYMCLLEQIPAYNEHPAHEHIDLIYVGRPSGGELKHNEKETDGLQWFSLTDLERLTREVDIFEETYQVIRHLTNLSCISLPSYLTCEQV